MKKLKFLFEEMILIAFGILVALSISGIIYHVKGDDLLFSWDYPLSIVLCAAICSLPGLLLEEMDKMSRGTIILRIMLHCILVYAITMAAGRIFEWYSQIKGFLIVTSLFIIVYVFVWGGILWLGQKEAQEINSALDAIRDEE